MTFAFLLPLLAQASLAQAAGPAADPNLDALVPRAPDRLQTCLHQAQDDPDAAINASRRLAAQYILRGLIDTEISRNAIINVNQVAVRLEFVLTGANGRMISQAAAANESYAGRDVLGMALTLVNERADEVVAQLYSDYCRRAGR